MKYVKRGALDCFTVVACEKRAAFGVCFAVGYEKRAAFGACFEVGYEKQAAFRGCHEVGGGKCGAFDCFTVVVCPNRTAFLCPWVGAYGIRPTGDPFMGRRIRMIDR